MSKGYILVDMPEKCKKCRFYYPARDMHTGEYVSGCRMIPTMVIREPEKKPDWCPIRELPKKWKYAEDIRNQENPYRHTE